MADHSAKATNSGIVQLSDAQYDFFRAILEKVLPGVAAFYALLAGLWHWNYIVEVTGSIGGLGVFLGILLALARKGYEPLVDVPKNGYDGEVVQDVTADGTPVVRVQLDTTAAQDILNRAQLVIKGFDANA
jgi:hypothetical protein